MCILRYLPQQKNPKVLCWGSSTNFICSYNPMKIFLFYETGRKEEIRRELFYIKGGSCTRVFSWGLETPSSSHTLGCPPTRTPKRTHLYWNQPYNIMGFSIWWEYSKSSFCTTFSDSVVIKLFLKMLNFLKLSIWNANFLKNNKGGKNTKDWWKPRSLLF